VGKIFTKTGIFSSIICPLLVSIEMINTSISVIGKDLPVLQKTPGAYCAHNFQWDNRFSHNKILALMVTVRKHFKQCFKWIYYNWILEKAKGIQENGQGASVRNHNTNTKTGTVPPHFVSYPVSLLTTMSNLISRWLVLTAHYTHDRIILFQKPLHYVKGSCIVCSHLITLSMFSFCT